MNPDDICLLVRQPLADLWHIKDPRAGVWVNALANSTMVPMRVWRREPVQEFISLCDFPLLLSPHPKFFNALFDSLHTVSDFLRPRNKQLRVLDLVVQGFPVQVSATDHDSHSHTHIWLISISVCKFICSSMTDLQSSSRPPLLKACKNFFGAFFHFDGFPEGPR